MTKTQTSVPDWREEYPEPFLRLLDEFHRDRVNAHAELVAQISRLRGLTETLGPAIQEPRLTRVFANIEAALRHRLTRAVEGPRDNISLELTIAITVLEERLALITPEEKAARYLASEHAEDGC